MRNPATKCLQCINTRPWVSVLLLYTIQSDEQLWRSEEKQYFESKHLITGCMSGAPPRLYGYNLLGQKSHCLGVDSDFCSIVPNGLECQYFQVVKGLAFVLWPSHVHENRLMETTLFFPFVEIPQSWTAKWCVERFRVYISVFGWQSSC
jgi:hypothetical protein